MYLHGLNYARVEGSALRNLKMFKELCGPDALKNTVLATTFWGEVNSQAGEEREAELASKDAFWGEMLEKGSRMARFTDRESGLEILSSLIGLRPRALKIQKELVEGKMPLIDTSAGRLVNEELVRLETKHRQELAQLKADMDDALRDKDEEVQMALKAQEERLEERMKKVHLQQEQLKADRRAEARLMQIKFDDQALAFEKQKGESDEIIKTLRKHNEQAVKRFEGLDIDAAIARVRAEESKIRAEERETLEAEIQKMKKTSGRKRDVAADVFFKVLNVALPMSTLLLLGVPIPLPNLAN